MKDSDFNKMMADLADVITSHHAPVSDVIEAGQKMIVSSFGQLANEGCPYEDLVAYASFQSALLHKKIIERIKMRKPVSN